MKLDLESWRGVAVTGGGEQVELATCRHKLDIVDKCRYCTVTISTESTAPAECLQLVQEELPRVCPSPQQLGPHQQEEEGGQQAPCPGWVQQQIRLQTAGNSTSEHQLVITTLQYNGEAGSSLAGQLTSAITKLGQRQNHDNSYQFCFLMIDINKNYLTNEYSFLSSVLNITLKVSIFLRSMEIVILSLPSV